MIGRFSTMNPLDDERVVSAEIVHPFITVIVTNYNYEKYIIQCLKSIAQQTYPYFKCIVVDDCSRDNSPVLIEKFIVSEEAKGRFTLIRHEQNGGQMAALKTGLKYAEGVFVVLVDADDVLFEDFLSAHVKAHMGKKSVAFTSSNQYQINENNELLAGMHADLKAYGKERYVKPMPLHAPFWIWATISSMMFRRSVLNLIMPDNTDDFRVCADNYICHFANIIGGSLLIPEVYGCYRRHRSNYFSCNPVVGGALPTGDMGKHPKHHIVRLNILSRILSNHEEFSALLSHGNFFMTLLRLTGPYEILKIKNRYPDYFKKGDFPFLSFMFASFIFKIKLLFKRYYELFRYALFANKRSNSDI